MTSLKTQPSLYQRIASLPLTIESAKYELLEQTTASGWTRCTTLIKLSGKGHTGQGEDVNYSEEEQRHFAASKPLQITAEYPSFDAFSHALDKLGTTFDQAPTQASSVLYRRWALESAALDLALRQAGVSLSEALNVTPKPMRFVASTSLGSPSSTKPLEHKLKANPELEFKIDYAEDYNDALLEELALFKVACVDYKGHYHGSFSGPPADGAMYQKVAEALPNAVLEDPAFSELDALGKFKDRLSWDYPCQSFSDVMTLPVTRWMNIKPSRFGLLSELLRVIEYCLARDIQMYGGGQFELGIGRLQAQEIASLFYADGPNDLAPSVYNGDDLPDGAPHSPLDPEAARGFGKT